ncbi:MAG: DUF4331 family protein [Myxococcales bacterium]|nr:DUF4331 domain-containing protein [Myxococcales bacterium]
MKKMAWARPVALAFLAVPLLARAADHTDGPAATADPTADITDLFAWTSSDGTKLNLVMDVFPAATASSKFSNTVQYVFHTQSHAAFGMAAAATEDILCTFDNGSPQRVSCWAGSEYVNGDASSTGGIASSSGKLRVFAGLRDDPFFFNLDGFKHVAATVKSAATSGSLPAPDAGGCYNLGDPSMGGTTANTLVQYLTHAADGTSAAVNHFHGLNVLALALQIDLSIVNKGGPVVSVWGSTNRP